MKARGVTAAKSLPGRMCTSLLGDWQQARPAQRLGYLAGLRRALGATRGHVRTQFVVESLLLALLGGAGGVVLGALATTGYATRQHWQVVVPLAGVAGGVAAALCLGAVAGLYPAMRAARLAPTDALRTA